MEADPQSKSSARSSPDDGETYTTVNVQRKDLQRVRELADEYKVPLSVIVRWALEDYVPPRKRKRRRVAKQETPPASE